MSNDDAIEYLEELNRDLGSEYYHRTEAINKAIKSLEQQPCEDCISREELTERLNEINGTAELDKVFEIVENMPSVKPIRTKGK